MSVRGHIQTANVSTPYGNKSNSGQNLENKSWLDAKKCV
jgi:hypothetical protein